MRDMTGATALQLQPTSADDLVAQLNSAERTRQWWPVLLMVPVVGWAVALWMWLRDGGGRAVVVFYEVEDATHQWFDDLTDRWVELSKTDSIWRVVASGALATTHQRKVNSMAGSVVSRTRASLDVHGPRSLRTNIQVPTIRVGRQALSLLPDRVLVRTGRRFTDLSYGAIAVGFSVIRFHEVGRVPRDSRRVGTTWKYANVNGGPDRRFNNNREIPILEYGQISLSSRGGLTWTLDVSNSATARAVTDTLRRAKTPPVNPSPVLSASTQTEAGRRAQGNYSSSDQPGTDPGQQRDSGPGVLTAPTASFGRRTAAHVIDVAMTTVIWLIFVGIYLDAAGVKNGRTGAVATALLFLLWPAVWLIYSLLALSRVGSHHGQTVGKEMLGIRVTVDDGDSLTLSLLLRREGLWKLLVAWLTLGITLIPRKRDRELHSSLHDVRCHTTVRMAAQGAALHKTPTVEPSKTPPQAPVASVVNNPEGRRDPSANGTPQVPIDINNLDEQPFSSGPRVPRSAEEQEVLLKERPAGWEYYLFASELLLQLLELEPTWQDLQLGISPLGRQYPDWRQAKKALESRFKGAGKILDAGERFLNQEFNDPAVQERSFGKPGQPGNPQQIQLLAKRGNRLYTDLLQAVAFLKSQVVPDELDDAYDVAALYFEHILTQYRAFVVDTVSQMDSLQDRIARAKAQGGQSVIDLKLDLKPDPNLTMRLRDAIEAIQVS